MLGAVPNPAVLEGDSQHLNGVWNRGQMRCKGCAAKVSPRILQEVLEELKIFSTSQNTEGTAGQALAQDDAAVIAPAAPGRVSVQTVDVLSAPVDDLHMFGRIAAVHALSDCFAMGAAPTTALAIVQVGVPYLPALLAVPQFASLHNTLPDLISGQEYEQPGLMNCLQGRGPEVPKNSMNLLVL